MKENRAIDVKGFADDVFKLKKKNYLIIKLWSLIPTRFRSNEICQKSQVG